MRFYRVDTSKDGGNSAGYEWFTNKREAEQHAAKFRNENPNEFVDVDTVDIVPSKKGILKALHLYASHPDNG